MSNDLSEKYYIILHSLTIYNCVINEDNKQKSVILNEFIDCFVKEDVNIHTKQNLFGAALNMNY